jgi:hypothetical protein
MALTYSKPVKRPDWGDTSTNITEPSSGFKDAGWLVNADHVSSYENWKANNISDWFKWFDERWSDGATKDDLKLTASLEVDATSHSATVARGIVVKGKGDRSGFPEGDGIRALGGDSLIADGQGSNGGVFFGGTGTGIGPGGNGISVEGGLGSSTGSANGLAGFFQGKDAAVSYPGDGGNGIQALGGDGYSTSDPGIGGIFTGGNAASSVNVDGGLGIFSTGGQGEGTQWSGAGIVGLGANNGTTFSLFSDIAAAGIVGYGGVKVGTAGAGGPGGAFYGRNATTGITDGGYGLIVEGGDGFPTGTYDGGHGVHSIGGVGGTTGLDGWGVAGFGVLASVSVDTNNQGSGLVGVGGSNDGYGAWLKRGGNRSPLHIEPSSAPTVAVIGDLYCSSGGILYICTNATGPVWTKVGLQT